MVRVFIILANLFTVLFLELIIGEDITLSTSATTEVVAGNEMLVTVTVQKGSVQSFARFQQNLPEGLIAYPDYTANALDFTFEENKIKIIWLRMPEEDEFSFSYRIQVDERLKGEFDLSGLFSYIDDNERKTSAMQQLAVNIQPNPDIDPTLIVDVRDFGRMTIPNYITPVVSTSDEIQIACIRQEPMYNPVNNEFLVNILVNKNELEQFAKIEENIPVGFTAVNVSSKDGIFTFRDQIAKIIWRNLPIEETFIVTYKLIPENGTPDQTLSLTGRFSYFKSDVTKTFDIVETQVNLAQLEPSARKEFVRSFLAGTVDEQYAEYKPETVITENQQTQDTQQNEQQEAEINTKNNLVPDNNTVIKPVKETKKPAPVSTNRQRSVFRKDRYALEAQSGVYYRVQIAAGHRKVNIPGYFKRYDLDYDVKLELHEGWHKYSVGSFSEYKYARDYRVHLWNTTEIDDAFVSAYNNGKRITVQEALMIANQKWYK